VRIRTIRECRDRPKRRSRDVTRERNSFPGHHPGTRNEERGSFRSCVAMCDGDGPSTRPFGLNPMREFVTSSRLLTEDQDEILAAMKDVQANGLPVARHLRGDVYEVRADPTYGCCSRTKGDGDRSSSCCRPSARRRSGQHPTSSGSPSAGSMIGGPEAAPNNPYLGYRHVNGDA
jgi:hypothetical protein